MVPSFTSDDRSTRLIGHTEGDQATWATLAADCRSLLTQASSQAQVDLNAADFAARDGLLLTRLVIRTFPLQPGGAQPRYLVIWLEERCSRGGEVHGVSLSTVFFVSFLLPQKRRNEIYPYSMATANGSNECRKDARLLREMRACA